MDNMDKFKSDFYNEVDCKIGGASGSTVVWSAQKLNEIINILESSEKAHKQYYYYNKKYMVQNVGEEVSLCLKNSEPRR